MHIYQDIHFYPDREAPNPFIPRKLKSPAVISYVEHCKFCDIHCHVLFSCLRWFLLYSTNRSMKNIDNSTIWGIWCADHNVYINNVMSKLYTRRSTNHRRFRGRITEAPTTQPSIYYCLGKNSVCTSSLCKCCQYNKYS